MTTAQINARIDSNLKESGDRSLASVGYTPTKAIRRLWEFASRNAHDRRKLRALFDELEGGQSQTASADAAQQRMERVKEGPLIFERALQEMGIEDHAMSGLSEDELLAQAYQEKWEERGLL